MPVLVVVHVPSRKIYAVNSFVYCPEGDGGGGGGGGGIEGNTLTSPARFWVQFLT